MTFHAFAALPPRGTTIGLALAASLTLGACGHSQGPSGAGGTPQGSGGAPTSGSGGATSSTASSTATPSSTSNSSATMSSATASSATTSSSTTATSTSASTTAASSASSSSGAIVDAGSTRDASAPDAGGRKLVWSDEFDTDGPPNPANWGFESGFVRNQELQWYQPDNATVKGGMLVIEARREQKANPNYVAGSTDWKKSRQFAQYTSSSLTTSGKHAFEYGRFEMRGRINTSQGSWPAFWVLGSATAWPQSGEVDIMEYYANKVLANVCKPMGSTCGWASVAQPLSKLGSMWSSDFHVWAMEWDAQTIDLFLDDVLVNHFNVADAVPSGTANPYTTKSDYTLVNLAIGGTNGGDPTNTTFPLRYEVDYVRVYQ